MDETHRLLDLGKVVYLSRPAGDGAGPADESGVEPEPRLLNPARIVAMEGERFTIECDARLAVQARSIIEVFCEIRGRFSKQTAEVVDVYEGAAGPVMSVLIVGEPAPADNRRSFRVPIKAGEVTAKIETEKKCPVVDISAEGFGVIAAARYRPGEPVKFTINYGKQTFSGLARVRTAIGRPDGLTRYGMRCATNSIETRRGLEFICATVQRQWLRFKQSA